MRPLAVAGLAIVATVLAVGSIIRQWHGSRGSRNVGLDEILGSGMADVVAAALPQGGRIAVVVPPANTNPHFSARHKAFVQAMKKYRNLVITAVETVPPPEIQWDPEGILLTDVLTPLVHKHAGVDAIVSLVGCANRTAPEGSHGKTPLLIVFCSATEAALERLIADGALDIAIIGRSGLDEAVSTGSLTNEFDRYYQVIYSLP